jgi:FkbM family methyltransferase
MDRAAWISATPNPVLTDYRESGTTTIAWSAGTGVAAHIFVSRDGGPEKLFASGTAGKPYGTRDVRWIAAGSTYEFRLYAAPERAGLLASTTVSGIAKQSPVRPNTQVGRSGGSRPEASPASTLRGDGRRIVSPDFRIADSHLLVAPLPPSADFVLVTDSDVGPILTDPRDKVIGGWLRTKRTWGPGEGHYLRSKLRPGMNAIDIGAHIGYFTLLCAREIGQTGRVLAVEAEPEFVLQLRANIALNELENVEVLPLAAHRQTGMMAIWRNPEQFGGSFDLVDPESTSTPRQAARLDDVLDPDTPIDVIKIDIEGMDHAAVQGLEATIRRWRPTILVEYHTLAIGLLGEDPVAVLRYYRSLGYQVSVLGTDALRLRDLAGMDLDELVKHDMLITEDLDARIAELTHRIGLINLGLTPLGRFASADRT